MNSQSIEQSQQPRRAARLLGAILFFAIALSCSQAPQRPNISSSQSGIAGSNDGSDDGELSLTNCSAPVKSTYRLTRTEMTNSIASILSLNPADAAALKGSLSLDTTKTGYENDLNSLQLTADQIFSLALALDTILTPAKIKTLINCGDKVDVQDSCVNAALVGIAKKAYAVTESSDSNISAYKSMLTSLKTKDSERLQIAIKNIFIAPKFLFGSTDKEGFKAHLANTLWLSSGEYSASTELKKLEDRAFVKALLTDEKSQRFAESFLMRRLKVDDMTKGLDPAASTRYSLLQSMGQESKLFIWDIFKSDRPVTDLLTSKQSFVNKELATIYGMPDPGEGFVKSDLPKNRQGLLTQASVLTVTSKPTETNIISRGLWIVEKVLCQHIPAAPSVEAIPENTGSKPVSPREQLEAHRAAPQCAGCHNLMDPPGFALENFGPMGAYRDSYENGLPIDSKAVFSDETVTQTPNDFFAYVEKRKDDFSNCFATELLTYVMRRSLTSEDKCAVDTLAKGMTEKGWGLETSLTEILSWYKK